MPSDLQRMFPGLRAGEYEIKSEKTDGYNCIAWVAHDTERWWDPYHYWPPEALRALTLDSFIAAFKTLGFEPCETNDKLEEGFEKVAIYVNAYGEPTHMARQLESGGWTSKLGELEDIEHHTLQGVECKEYGAVTQALKRPR